MEKQAKNGADKQATEVENKRSMPLTTSPQSGQRRLARLIGNQAMQQRVQTKLQVNAPPDPQERQADTVAHQVVNNASPAPITPIKRPTTSSQGLSKATWGVGKPLDQRQQFEQRLGHDLEDVRVHTGAQAAEAAQALKAQAFTVKSDIVFNKGAYKPHVPDGRRLLAHELTHVIQQQGSDGRVQRQALPYIETVTDDPAEKVAAMTDDELRQELKIWLAFDHGFTMNPAEQEQMDYIALLVQEADQRNLDNRVYKRLVAPLASDRLRALLKLWNFFSFLPLPDKIHTEIKAYRDAIKAELDRRYFEALQKEQELITEDVLWDDYSAYDWEPVKEGALLVRTRDKVYILPAQDYVHRPIMKGHIGDTVKSPKAPVIPKPAPPRPRYTHYGVPAASKEGRRLVRTADGIGVWLDTGGTNALIPQSAAALRTRMGIRNISHLLYMHVHADHVRNMIGTIVKNNIPASHVVLSDAFVQGTSGPLMGIVELLKNPTGKKMDGVLTSLKYKKAERERIKSRFIELGYGPKWQPASPAVSNLPTTGIFEIGVPFANNLRLVGRGEAFHAYAQAHKKGKKVDSHAVDAASFVTFVRDPGARYDIAVTGDLRGRNFLKWHETMEQVRKGSFAEMFAKVRVFSGFQHHMGVIEKTDDIRGLRLLLESTMRKTGELTVIVQSQQKFYKDYDINYLRRNGVRVIIADTPIPGEKPSNVVVNTQGQVSVRGSQVRVLKGQRAPILAYQRIELMRNLIGLLDVMEMRNMSRAQVEKQLQVQIRRLEDLLKQRHKITLGMYVREVNELHKDQRTIKQDAAWATSRTLEQNTRELNQRQGIEARITRADLDVVRRMAPLAPKLRLLRREMNRLRRTGEASPQLFRLVHEFAPNVPRNLRVDRDGRPVGTLVPGRGHVELGGEPAQLRPSALRGGARPINSLLVGVEVVNMLGPTLAIKRQVDLTQNILKGVRIYDWWVSKRVKPVVRGAVDPFFSGATIYANQQDVMNRVKKRVWANTDPEYRKDKSELDEGIRRAGGLEYFWIKEIPDSYWSHFEDWILLNVRNFDDFARYFLDEDNEAVKAKGSSFRESKWYVRLSDFDTNWINELEHRWVHIERFDAIMKATADRVVETTWGEIEKAWERRDVQVRVSQQTSAWEARTDAAPDLSDYVDKSAEEMRPLTRARFRGGASRTMFAVADPSYKIVKSRDVPSDCYFYVYKIKGPFALVSGANYDTYIQIRGRKTKWIEEVKMPRYRAESLKDPYGLKAPKRRERYQEVASDDELSDTQKQAMKDLLEDKARFVGYSEEESSWAAGKVVYEKKIPNTFATALVYAGALIIEE